MSVCAVVTIFSPVHVWVHARGSRCGQKSVHLGVLYLGMGGGCMGVSGWVRIGWIDVCVSEGLMGGRVWVGVGCMDGWFMNGWGWVVVGNRSGCTGSCEVKRWV